MGARPMKRNDKKDWAKILALTKANKMNEIAEFVPDVYVRYYCTLRAIAKDSMKFVDRPDVCGYWIWGKTGLGKSHAARASFPNHYPKDLNRWWDGYQGQENVIMDDISPD